MNISILNSRVIIVKSSKIWFNFLLNSLFFALVLTGVAHAEQDWKIRSEGIERLDSDENTIYRFESGYLDGTHSSFENGIIEFELKPTRERAFFYVYFRKQSTAESEVVYIRTHKSNAPDTIQYSPVYQNKSAWQLYHGINGTGSAALPLETWVKVKLQVIGNKLTMWVGDNPEPNVKNMKLTGNGKTGSISFRGFIPIGSAAKYTAMMRNIKIQHLQSSDAVIENEVRVNPSIISKYNVSPAFEVTTKSSPEIPQEVLNQKWNAVTTDSQGVLELLRHRAIPKGIRTWAVAADVTLNAKQATHCQVDFGYSDAITLLLNGKTEFFADASYRYSEKRQEGLMHAKQMSIFLELKKGKNVLRAIVADSFGGWGLQAQLLNCDGVNIVHSAL